MLYKEFPTLYAISKTGAIRTYVIKVFDCADENKALVTTSKQMKIGGKVTTDTYEYTTGKNIGKSNETTYLQQALLEAESMFKKQLDNGFSEVMPDADQKYNTDANGRMKPMLASSDISKIKFPCICQPKYDGVRCLVFEDDNNEICILSRKGKSYNIPHLIEWCKRHRDMLPLDGELYNHKEITFQDITSAVKKVSELTNKINYVVYDKPVDDLSNDDRLNIIREDISSLPDTDPVKLSPCKLCYNFDDIKKYHDECVEDGYEGVIVRNMGGKYEFGFRSNDLIKYKEFMDDEFTVADVIEGTGRDKGTGIFVLYLHGHEGEPITPSNTFKAKPKGDINIRKEYFVNKHKYIGELATIKFQGFSKLGIPRFPNMVAIRDYE